jgi:hypothetical protein
MSSSGMMRVQVVCKRHDAAASVALEITAINIQASHDFLYCRPGQAAVFRGMRDIPVAALGVTAVVSIQGMSQR